MNRKKPFIAIFLWVFAATMLLGLTAILLAPKTLWQPEKPAADKKDDVPYAETPETAAFLWLFPNQSATLLVFDFENGAVRPAYLSYYEDETERFGYEISFTARPDYSFLADWIDRFGGVELSLDGEPMRYTGWQVIDLFAATPQSEGLCRSVVDAVLNAMAENGLSRNDLVFLLEKAHTDLTLPECFLWPERLPTLLNRIQWIN